MRDNIVFCPDESNYGDGFAAKCDEISSLFDAMEPLDVEVKSITEIYMTPIANFISPNDWAKYYFECGRSLVRRETYSECQYE